MTADLGRKLDAARSYSDAPRDPRELFADLRLRLERLAANHPSSWDRDSARDADQAVDPPRSAEHPKPADRPEPLVPIDLRAGEVTSRADGPHDDQAEEHAEDLVPDQREPGSWRIAARWWSDPVDFGRAGPDRPYRPWFVGGDLGAPWFTEPTDADWP